MSYADSITTGDAPRVTRRPALAKLALALVIAVVVVIAAATVLIAMGSGAGSDTGSAAPIGHINYGGFNPAIGQPESAPLPQQERSPQSNASSDRPQASPFPGLSKQAEQAVPGKSSKENDPGGSAAPKPDGPKIGSQPGPIIHPRAIPPVDHTTP
jgi:hypothetical protein